MMTKVLMLMLPKWMKWSRVSSTVLTQNGVSVFTDAISNRKPGSEFVPICSASLVATADDLDNYNIIQQMDDEIDIVMNEEMNNDAGMDAYY